MLLFVYLQSTCTNVSSCLCFAVVSFSTVLSLLYAAVMIGIPGLGWIYQ